MITAVLGELKIAVPIPRISTRHMKSIGWASPSRVASESREPLTSSNPRVQRRREPKRSEAMPEKGEISSIARGMGMISRPVVMVLKPRASIRKKGPRAIAADMPMNCRIAAPTPAENPRPLKRPRSTTGLALRRSTMMKETRKIAQAANSSRMIGLVQPRSPPRLMPSVRAPRMPKSRNAPGTSRPFGRDSAGASTSSLQARKAPTRPKGARVQKIARQSSHSTRMPPSTGPAAKPAPTVETMIPSPVPRLEGGNEAVMMAAPLAIVIAEPTAWRTRALISSPSDPENAASMVAMVKIAKPTV